LERTFDKKWKKKIGVVVTAISGSLSVFIPQHLEELNISHRSSWEEVTKKNVQAVCTIELAEDDPTGIFQEFIDYFTSKDRAGVVGLENGNFLYLIPPGVPLFDKYKPVSYRPNTLLGLCALCSPQSMNASSGLPVTTGGSSVSLQGTSVGQLVGFTGGISTGGHNNPKQQQMAPPSMSNPPQATYSLSSSGGGMQQQQPQYSHPLQSQQSARGPGRPNLSSNLQLMNLLANPELLSALGNKRNESNQ